MENCLKTQLKENVNNDNLNVLNKLTLNVRDLPNYHIDSYRFGISGATKIEVVGSGTFSVNEAGSYTSHEWDSSPISVICTKGDYKLLVYSKYAIVNFSIPTASNGQGITLDMSQLDYTPTFGEVYIPNAAIRGSYNPHSLPNLDTMYIGDNTGAVDGIDFSIDSLAGAASLQYFSFSDNRNVRGNISTLASIPNLKEFTMNSNKVNGNIESLGSATGINYIGAQNCAYIAGEVTTLAAAQVAAGRTTGSLILLLTGTGCTWNGDTIAARVKITFDSSVAGGYSIAES